MNYANICGRGPEEEGELEWGGGGRRGRGGRRGGWEKGGERWRRGETEITFVK